MRRYRAATQHLADFAVLQGSPLQAHEVRADRFAAYLREIEVAPNGHANTAKRRLRDKGVKYILETCRAMFTFAAKRRHLPPYAGNPFAELPIDRMRIEDSKPIFVFDSDAEAAFLRESSRWALPIHFTLAKTGLRIGELVHLMVEDLELARGWLSVRNRPDLGWRVKTGQNRQVPLIAELVALLQHVIGARTQGLVFLRERLKGQPALVGNAASLIEELHKRLRATAPKNRTERQALARSVWRDAGAVNPDEVRHSFIRVMRRIGHSEATCPKSWRHSFATLMQDANVDPLIRQLTLGHAPNSAGGLGMTANYTHTRAETQKQQVETALRRWPLSLELVRNFMEGERS